MEYHLITEDSGSGLSFWKLLNSALFNDQLQLNEAMIYDKKGYDDQDLYRKGAK